MFVALWVSVASAMRQTSAASRSDAGVTRVSAAKTSVVVVEGSGALEDVVSVIAVLEHPVATTARHASRRTMVLARTDTAWHIADRGPIVGH